MAVSPNYLKIFFLLILLLSFHLVMDFFLEPELKANQPMNDFSHHFGSKPCARKSQWAMIVVMSAPHHVTIRKTIRETWGQDIKLDQRMSLVFFLGKSPIDYVDDIVDEESKFTQDIVQADVLDVPDNRSRLDAKFATWTKRFCLHGKWILKINDCVDTDWRRIESALRDTRGALNTIHCAFLEQNPIEKQMGSSSKWNLTRTFEEVRSHCQEQSLLFTLSTVHQLVKHQSQENWVKTSLKFVDHRNFVIKE